MVHVQASTRMLQSLSVVYFVRDFEDYVSVDRDACYDGMRIEIENKTVDDVLYAAEDFIIRFR